MAALQLRHKRHVIAVRITLDDDTEFAFGRCHAAQYASRTWPMQAMRERMSTPQGARLSPPILLDLLWDCAKVRMMAQDGAPLSITWNTNDADAVSGN